MYEFMLARFLVLFYIYIKSFYVEWFNASKVAYYFVKAKIEGFTI